MKKRILKAQSIIERDALLARLHDSGIEAVTAARDVSRKITDTTLDLAHGTTYAIDFDGFSIFVDEADEAQALQIVAAARREYMIQDAEEIVPEDPWRRFYFCSLWSIVVPIVLNIYAMIHLRRALKSGAKPQPLYLFMSLVAFAIGVAGGYAIFSHYVHS